MLPGGVPGKNGTVTLTGLKSLGAVYVEEVMEDNTLLGSLNIPYGAKFLRHKIFADQHF